VTIIAALLGGFFYLQNERGITPEEVSPLELIQSRIAEVSPSLDQIESRISSDADLAVISEELENIEQAIEDLESRQVDDARSIISDLRLQYQGSLRTLHVEENRRAELRLESDARERLADLLMDSEISKSAKDRLPTLEALVSNYPNTRAGERAQEILTNLRAEIAQQDLRDQAAERDWNWVRSRAEGWMLSDQPGRARKEVLSLSEEHQNTAAWDEREDMLLRIDQHAVNMWRQARTEIRSFLELGRKAQANDLLNQLISRASMPATKIV